VKSVDPLERWFAPVRFGLLIACLIAVCFLPVLLGSQSFFFRDFATFSYPLAVFHKEAFLRGEIPLWNPFNSCGLPFLAQWNTMVFYPLSLIYIALPLPWSLNFFCLFHFWLAGMGMYFLAREWTQNNFAAAIAGVAFIFGGVLLSCLKWPNNIAALGWMPWIVLAVDRAFKGGARAFGIAALLGATQMLTGAPEVILLTWAFLAAWAGLKVFSEKPLSFKVPLVFIAVILAVAGLSAVQLAPFVDLLRHSQRSSATAGFLPSEWPMPIWGWANFFVPLFRAFESYHGVFAQPQQYWISTYYVALPVMLLATLGPPPNRRGHFWLLTGLLLLVCWIALGENGKLYTWLRAIVPRISMMRFPIKFVVLAAFLLPLLGAFGATNLMRLTALPRKRLFISAAAITCIIAGLIVFSELRPFRYTATSVISRNALARIFFVGCALGSILWFATDANRRHFASGALLLVATLDGLTHAPWHNPTTPSWVYAGTIAEMEIKPKLGTSRALISPEAAFKLDHLKFENSAEDVLALRIALFANINLLDGIPKADGFYAIYPGRIFEFQKTLYRNTNSPPGVLDFLGASQISVPGSWSKWQTRATTLPLITSPVLVRPAERPLEEVLKASFDPRSEAIVPSGLNIRTGQLARAEISAVDWKPERISFTAVASGPSLVVVAQTHFHAWKAFVSERPVEIVPVNHAFQGIFLPEGSHSVRLEYHDSAFRIGGIISGVFSLLVTISILFPPKQLA
jgi:hypothetical protein